MEQLTPEELLELRLRAAGRDGLLPLLQTAKGALLASRFRIRGLLAAGAQVFVFDAIDLEDGTQVVVKQVAFDYRKTIRYTEDLTQRLRQGLKRDFQILRSAQKGVLPKPIALLEGPAIVGAAERNFALAKDEVFLVEEKVEGETLREQAFRNWRSLEPLARESVAKKVGWQFWEFWNTLHLAGWFYSDVSPTNLMIERSPVRLRIVDVGSVIPVAAQILVAGYTPAFTTPKLLAAFRSSTPVTGTAAVMFPMLAKMLYFLLTLREPLNGIMPDLGVSELARCSPLCAPALAKLLKLDSHPEEVGQAEELFLDWTQGAASPAYPTP